VSPAIKFDRLIPTRGLIAPRHRCTMGWFPGDIPARLDHATSHPCTGPPGHPPTRPTGSGDRPDRRIARVALLDGSPPPRQVPPPGARGDRSRLSTPRVRPRSPLRGDPGRLEIATPASLLGGRPDPGPSAPGDAGAVRPLREDTPTHLRGGRPRTGEARAAAEGRPGPRDPASRDLADGCKRAYKINRSYRSELASLDR
jgi:hypothetical protein